MVGGFCNGRECKLGWGYNESSLQLIPVEGEPQNVKPEALSGWWYSSFNLLSNNVVYNYSPTLLLEPSCKKFFDFGIVFDDNKYWEVHCYYHRRRERAGKLPNYPLNCSHFISLIWYGVDLRVQFSKTEFPEKDTEVREMFKERNFDEFQKEVKCRILINYNEIKEMTLGELMKFMQEIEEQKDSQEDIPVLFWCEDLTQNFQKIDIINEEEFTKFLSHLYCIYRKIEMKMENVRYPYIFSSLDSKDKSLVNICSNLKTVKEDYVAMEKNDFLNMYPVLKKLFLCYIDYIRYCVTHTDMIDEGNYLPGAFKEIKSWIEEVNTWFPMEVNQKWINCMGSFIGIPDGFDRVAAILRGTAKFSDSQVIKDEETVEPYIGKEHHRKILFGFVDMEKAKAVETFNDSSLLELECPKECTQDMKKWICTTCGEYVRIMVNVVGWQFLLCSCGSKRYKDTLLSCHHPNHRS